MDAAAWGVVTGYHDANGRWCEPSPPTIEAILDALGASDDEPPSAAVRVVRAGETTAVGRGVLELEDGTALDVDGSLPPDVPLGYHRLHEDADGDRQTALIVSPGRCHLSGDARAWGWAVQLYAMRSRQSCGIGDLADLRELARWSRAAGAGFVLVNPLHAALPVLPQEASPYFPSSRRFRNPLYLRVDGCSTQMTGPVIDRDEVFRVKLDALERRWDLFTGDPDFDAYRAAEGDALESYATFCALVEEDGRPWQDWPPALRRPESAAVARFREANHGRVLFHEWLQWLLDRQVADASGELAVVHDLAVGVDRAGADAWLWQDVFAFGASTGAPPDDFNAQGQDWGLPPFDPWRLRATAYEPFVQTVRAAFGHAGGIRLDHVMGLFRLYWVPSGAEPTDGAYVRYPWRDLLDIVALESARAGAFVVGEDLGTVEPEVREELAARGVLSYRLVWFEPGSPRDFPRQALAAVTTHDLPTIAGVWSGRDGTHELRERLRAVTGLSDDAPVEDVVLTAYEQLAGAPCDLVAASLEDALGVEERPNVPGTTNDPTEPGARPNWSLALPSSLEDIEGDGRVQRLVDALQRGRRGQDVEPSPRQP